jgi:hypothetical protein
MNIRWWQWLPIFRWRLVAVVHGADNVPNKLPRNGAVLVGSIKKPKWIAFDCPCGNGHRILLNLDQSRWPYWLATVKKPLTILPSIDYRDNAKRCHYVIRKGKVKWIP